MHDVLLMVSGNFGSVYDLDGVGAFYVTCYPLGKAAKFVGSREVPSIFEF